MRRIISIAILAVSTIGMLPSHAVTVSAASAYQAAGIQVYGYAYPVTYQGYLNIYTTAGETSTGPAVSPVATFQASGDIFAYNYQTNVATQFNFPNQTVSPTALTMDPAGNSATITACLTASQGGPCHQFTLSMTKPQSLNVGLCPLVLCLPNAYVTPDGSSAGGSAYEGVGINRAGYTISGLFDGAAIPAAYGLYGYSYNGLGASVNAAAP